MREVVVNIYATTQKTYTETVWTSSIWQSTKHSVKDALRKQIMN